MLKTREGSSLLNSIIYLKVQMLANDVQVKFIVKSQHKGFLVPFRDMRSSSVHFLRVGNRAGGGVCRRLSPRSFVGQER